MGRSHLLLVLAFLVAGSAGCLGPTEDEPLQEDSQTNDTTDDEQAGDEPANATNGGMAWTAGASYDYILGAGSTGTDEIEVPENASVMTVVAVFQYWPLLADVPGACSSETEVVIEVADPGGTLRLNHSFSTTLEQGTSRENCSPVESITVQDPAPGNWTVTFQGDGVAVGQVGFEADG